MPAYKTIDKKTGRALSWYAAFWYSDYTGRKRKKLKRGFSTRTAALEWERAFLEYQAATPDMSMETLCALYIEDMSARLKPTTIDRRKKSFSAMLFPSLVIRPSTPSRPRT